MEASTLPRTICLQCGQRLRGRIDKKFCDDSCRNRYHYQLRREEQRKIKQINYRLKRNRRILQQFVREGVREVHRDDLIRLGFDFAYHTHIYYCTDTHKLYKGIYNMVYREVKNNIYTFTSLGKKEQLQPD